MRLADLKVGVITYWVSLEYIYAVLLDEDNHTEMFELMRYDEAFPLIDEFFGMVHEPSKRSSIVRERAFNAFSVGWGTKLLPPRELLDPFDILVIIPHHTLHGLPFHIVSLEQDDQYLCTSHGITYCSSGTLFLRCVDRNPARSFDLSSWEFRIRANDKVHAWRPPERCLSCGRDILGDQDREYISLAKHFSSYFKSGEIEDFSCRSLVKRPDFDVVCIVCHGYRDPSVSDYSGMLLGASGGIVADQNIFLHQEGNPFRFRDLPFKYIPPEIELNKNFYLERPELLTVGELKVHHYSAEELVALLGCNTGSGDVVAGDDYNSLAYQWLKSGAVSILANVWEADFEPLSNLSALFLDNWITKRQPKAIALKEALRQLFLEDPKLRESPYLWGGLVLLGDWL